jgi:RNA-directed DNA polymerase
MQYRSSRQEVTGLVVNKKVNIRAEYRHTVRAMVHRLLNTGSYEITTESIDAGGNVTIAKAPGELSQLHGMLGFIDGVDVINRALPKAPGTAKESLSSKEEMYSQFLLYKEFYAAKAPVLICEGATDNVYLLHAIRQMAKQYPDLALVDAAGKIELKVRLFKYARSSTGRILRIRGGTGDLKNWMARYDAAMRGFKAPGKQNPVIIVVDNDDGAKGIWALVEAITKQKPSAADPYTHVRGNLYVIPIPVPAGKTSAAIESCFDAATLAAKVDGKTFRVDKAFDKGIHLSKIDFAHRVIAPHADNVNFKGFGALLNNISAVIADHKKKYP